MKRELLVFESPRDHNRVTLKELAEFLQACWESNLPIDTQVQFVSAFPADSSYGLDPGLILKVWCP